MTCDVMNVLHLPHNMATWPAITQVCSEIVIMTYVEMRWLSGMYGAERKSHYAP